MTEENIVYEVVPEPGRAGKRRELARFIEDPMPLKHTRAFTFARRYCQATGHPTKLEDGTGFTYGGPKIVGYHVGADVVCKTCGLDYVWPDALALMAYVTDKSRLVFASAAGELTCRDCGDRLFTPTFRPGHHD